MLLRKLRAFAEIIGFVVLFSLAVYGAWALFQNASTAQAQARETTAPPNPAQSTEISVSAAPPSLELAGAVVASTVPQMIGYQGVLRDNEGKPISGQKNITFRIYDNVTTTPPTSLGDCKAANPCKWAAVHKNVTVRDGRFSVLLGNESNPITPTLMTSPNRFIGVQVEGYQEMQPLQRFSSVPFAMWSEKAAHSTIAGRLGNPDGTLVNGVNVWKGLYFQQSGLSPSDNLPYARLEEAWGMRYNSPDTRWVFSSKPSVLIGYLPTGQDWGTGNLLVEGKVGIGTSNPSSDPRDKLHVAGRAQFSKSDGNTAFFVDTLSTTAAELHTEGAPVNINAKNNWLGINQWAGTGDVYIGNGSNSLNVNGEIHGRLRYTGIYRWEQGQEPIQTIPSQQGFCFITYFRGKFEGSGELVSAYISDDGFWYLSGSSYQTGIAVEARCAG